MFIFGNQIKLWYDMGPLTSLGADVNRHWWCTMTSLLEEVRSIMHIGAQGNDDSCNPGVQE